MASKTSACTNTETVVLPGEPVSVQCVARALGDEHRLTILQMIHAEGRLSCGALVKRLPLAQATVSHHLKELTQAGLLLCEEEGPYNLYSLRPETLIRFTDQLHQQFLQTKP